MILVDILSIAELILPPPYTLDHKTTSDKFLAEILQKPSGSADSPRADNTSHWGTPWPAGHQLDEKCEWYRQRPETALGQWWVYEWRPPLSLVTPPPVTNTHDQGVPRTYPTLPGRPFITITSLFSAVEPNGGFSCSSRSLSSWVRRWGLRGEPARAWQKMEVTAEVLNLEHPWHVRFGGMKRRSLIEKQPFRGIHLYFGCEQSSGVNTTTSYSQVVTSATDRISCLASGWQTYSTAVVRARFCISVQGVPFPSSTEK